MYPNLVAQALRKTVVNLGCPGYGTLQEEIIADEWLGRLKPKWLILEIYPGNDWLDNYDFTHWRLAHNEVPYELHHKIVNEKTSCVGMLYQAHALLVGRSLVYTTIYNLWREHNPIDGWVRADERAAEIGEGQAFAAVSRLNRLCARKNVKLLILLVRIQSTLDEMNPGYLRIRKFLNKKHIDFVDPYAKLFLVQRNGQELFLPDKHWNGAGQAIVARLISRKMRE